MRTIWKFPIEIKGEQLVEMPEDSRIVHVGLDPAGCPCIWALVQTENTKMMKRFWIYGTGHGVIADERYIGTFVQDVFVWHVFAGGDT